MVNITISRVKIEKQKGMVVLPVEEYKKLLERSAPTYYLSGGTAKKLDNLVKEGLEDYRTGRTKRIKSLTDLD